MPMNCANIQKQLSAYFDGELPLAARAEVAAHLSTCGECTKRLERIQSLSVMAKRLPDEAAPPMWASIERELAGAVRPASKPATVGIEWRSWMRRRGIAYAAVAAALVIGTFVFYPSMPPRDSHAEMAMNLTGYVEAFRKDPERAQHQLLGAYASKAVKPEEVMTLINYKPLAPETFPSGLKRTAMYEIDMPCCKCVESLYRRADGRMVAVFEHADKQPASFGNRPAISTKCHGKDIGLVQCDGELCANWKEEERFVTVVGASELAEVDEIVEAFGHVLPL